MTTPSPIARAEHAGPQLFSRAELVAAGSGYRLRCALRAGQLVAVSPGVYARPGFGVADPVAAHRAAVHALLSGPAGGSVASHLSAAVLHGLPLPGDVPQAVHVTRAPPAKSRAGVRLIVHRRSLHAGESVEIGGLAATSLPRTVIDCLLVLPPAAGMALVEAALRVG
ncbi:type IV toxin-antitoxin system AbiEi family antitoxin domain-containing protein, partial [Nakamurella sp. GG22]